MKQAHFIVVVESDGYTFIDWELSQNTLPGAVWDTDKEQWRDDLKAMTFAANAQDKLEKLFEKAGNN
jgi:hypothetical protein